MKYNIKKQRKKIKLIHIITIALSIYTIFTFIRQNLVIKEVNNEKLEVEKTLKKLKDDVKDLEGKIDKTNSVEYIERIAREELKMVKPNEMIYIDKDKYEEDTSVNVLED